MFWSLLSLAAGLVIGALVAVRKSRRLALMVLLCAAFAVAASFAFRPAPSASSVARSPHPSRNIAEDSPDTESSLDDKDGPTIDRAPRGEKEPIREYYLRRLHEDHVESFVKAQGFGNGRMGGTPTHFIGLGGGLGGFGFGGGGNFVDRVFTLPDAEGAPPSDNHNWRVENLFLVGLIMHEASVVYDAPFVEIWRRDWHKKSSITRPLDDFEEKSLASLRKGAEIKIEYSPEEIRLFGAIRAGQSCLNCHTVKKGALLGAFTCEIRPVQPDGEKGADDDRLRIAPRRE